MKIRPAVLDDVEACLEIYNTQIDYEAVHGDLTAWRRDVYPTRDDIRAEDIQVHTWAVLTFCTFVWKKFYKSLFLE